MDAKLRAMLKELGDAINASVSDSDAVAEAIEKIRAHGYELNLNLDARISVSRQEEAEEDGPSGARAARESVDFRIDFRDLRFLKSVGIDPTRRVRARRATRRRAAL